MLISSPVPIVLAIHMLISSPVPISPAIHMLISSPVPIVLAIHMLISSPVPIVLAIHMLISSPMPIALPIHMLMSSPVPIACGCNGHSDVCVYNEVKGRGVCIACRNHTMGDHCDTCNALYRRNWNYTIPVSNSNATCNR